MNVVFVVGSVSQIDEPVYAAMAASGAIRPIVYYYNSYGLRRTIEDPELGVVPIYPDAGDTYKRVWVNTKSVGLATLTRRILETNPCGVVLGDLPIRVRQLLAFVFRVRGIRVGLRSDKNSLSDRARVGLPLQIERAAIRYTYDFLAPISPLTLQYYGWPVSRPHLQFPYSTPDDYGSLAADRLRARRALGIENKAFVYLAVAKFVERENPGAVIRAFERLQRISARGRLVIVGAGPLFDRERRYVRENVANASLVGYVPYSQLGTYFAAADTFLHLARSEPWGVSVQDALYAGLGVIASTQVGSARHLLKGQLARYLVEADDVVTTAERMAELLGVASVSARFAAARDEVARAFTVQATVRAWGALSWLR